MQNGTFIRNAAAAAQVRTVPVSTKRMALSELRVQPAKTEQVRSVEASLRLDAVASAGFRISRAKAADLIKAGDVRYMRHLAACLCVAKRLNVLWKSLAMHSYMIALG